jgi:hypothetical protein
VGLIDKAKEAVQSLIGAAASGGAEAVTGPVKAVTGAAKNVVDIRKSVVETRLAERRLEHEESLIQRATLDDVKQYDPKTQRLVSAVKIYILSSIAGGTGSGVGLDIARLLLSPKILRTRSKIMGSIRMLECGRFVAKDRTRKIVAVYDPQRNRTYRPGGRIIGKGDQLQRALGERAESTDRNRSRLKIKTRRPHPEHPAPEENPRPDF